VHFSLRCTLAGRLVPRAICLMVSVPHSNLNFVVCPSLRLGRAIGSSFPWSRLSRRYSLSVSCSSIGCSLWLSTRALRSAAPFDLCSFSFYSSYAIEDTGFGRLPLSPVPLPISFSPPLGGVAGWVFHCILLSIAIIRVTWLSTARAGTFLFLPFALPVPRSDSAFPSISRY